MHPFTLERPRDLAAALGFGAQAGRNDARAEYIGGENRWHAVLGTSENCIAAHASDLAVALVALDAAVELRSENRQRTVPLTNLYHLPDATPHIETVLEQG